MHDLAERVGLTEVRYGRDGHNHLDADVDDSNPYFNFDATKCIVCSRCVRACDEIQGTLALTDRGPRLRLRQVSAGGTSFMESECVSCGACVQACPTDALQERSIVMLGMPTRSVETTCAYCGVGCSFKAEVKGDEVVRMVAVEDRWRQRGSLVRQGPVRLRLRQPRRPGDDSAAARVDRRRVARGELGRGHWLRGPAIPRDPRQARRRVDRRHQLVAMHERRGLRRPEDGARRVRQQQRRHLRPGLPLPHRIRPQADLRHVGRHPGLRVGRPGRRHRRHRRQPDRRATPCSRRG